MRESPQELGDTSGDRVLREQMATDVLLRGIEPN